MATWPRRCWSSYGQKAITYAIPARITDMGEGDSPFVTWSELSAIHASGVIDVQSHTDSHSRIFVSSDVEDFVQPGYAAHAAPEPAAALRAACARVRDAGRSSARRFTVCD